MSKVQQHPQDGHNPRHPIISDTLHRVADIIELLEELDLSDGLTPNTRAGLYWIHRMLRTPLNTSVMSWRDRHLAK